MINLIHIKNISSILLRHFQIHGGEAMGIDWVRLKDFAEFLQMVLPSPEQVIIWIVFNPVTLLEEVLALLLLRSAISTLNSGLKLQPMYIPDVSVYKQYGYVEDGKPLPPLPQPMPVPAHWYRIVVGIIYLSLSGMMWYLASRGGWF